jgi:bifunctional polynucleotide phosphatase/kinase
MWHELERMSREDGVVLGMNVHLLNRTACNSFTFMTLSDKEKSFYVGDAAGRTGDFAGTDRKWAMNVGLRFYTPEVRTGGHGRDIITSLIVVIFQEYFMGLKPAPFKLQGFNVSSLPQNRMSSQRS